MPRLTVEVEALPSIDQDPLCSVLSAPGVGVYLAGRGHADAPRVVAVSRMGPPRGAAWESQIARLVQPAVVDGRARRSLCSLSRPRLNGSNVHRLEG